MPAMDKIRSNGHEELDSPHFFCLCCRYLTIDINEWFRTITPSKQTCYGNKTYSLVPDGKLSEIVLGGNISYTSVRIQIRTDSTLFTLSSHN